MDRTERLYRIKKLLNEYKVVPKKRFLDTLEISPATFKRDLAYLRDRLNVPIDYDTEASGYRINTENHTRHELPGVWFNAAEIHALLTMQQLLQELQPGLLTPHIKPLLNRLQRLIDSPAALQQEAQKRIRVLRVNGRPIHPHAFDPASTALLCRRQLTIQHFHRARNTIETRTLSPQRLTYYRDNWYLDAWCHLREDIRSFSLDAIEHIELLDEPALDLTNAELDTALTTGYGIFSGKNLEWATLRFAPERARWVSRELWHPQQQGELQSDGYYLLRVPYNDDRELVMDILRHMPEVNVLEPASLRERVKTLLEKGLAVISSTRDEKS